MAPLFMFVPKVTTAQAVRETSAIRSVGAIATSWVRLTVLGRSPILHPSGRQRGATLLSQQVR
jgi:hypothetical protein